MSGLKVIIAIKRSYYQESETGIDVCAMLAATMVIFKQQVADGIAHANINLISVIRSYI